MSWPKPAAALALALALIAAAPAARTPAPPPPVMRPASADTFPDGEGRALAERSCTLCHSPMLITQQAKDSAAWSRSIAQMEKWGVGLTPEERDTLVRWLAAAQPKKP